MNSSNNAQLDKNQLQVTHGFKFGYAFLVAIITTMFACSLALHLGRELRYMYRFTQYWRTTSYINVWPHRYIEKSASCFTSLNLNLPVQQGLHDSAFWRAATRKLVSSHSLENSFKIQDDVNEVFQTFAEKFPVNSLDPSEAADCLKFIKTYMLCTLTGFQNQPPDTVIHHRNSSEILMHVCQNTYFQSLLNHVQGHVSHFTAANNAELFACLATLGISFKHSIMQELISLFHDEKYPMSLNDLALIVHSIIHLDMRNDLFFLQVCMPRLQKSYETNNFIKNTSCTLPRLARLLPLFRFIQSSKMRDWYTEKLLSMAEDSTCMNLDSVKNICTMFINGAYRSLPLSCVLRLAIVCFKETEKRLHELKPNHITAITNAGRLCAEMKLGVTTEALDIVEKIHFSALNMLQKISASTSLAEILMLLSGVKLGILDDGKKEQFGALVAERLEEANINELIRVTFSNQLSEVINETYNSAFDIAIDRNMDRIMAVPAVFRRISNYYASLSPSLPLYRTILFRLHETQMMFEQKGFVYLSQMIMCTLSENKPIPRLIIDRIETMISQFSLFGIAVLLRGLDYLHRNNHKHAMIIDLHIQLERAFVEKIETTTELEKLYDVTYKLNSFGISKDRHANKFNRLFDRMAKLSHFMTTDDFHQIVVLICRIKLYQTVVLDTLTKYFIEHNEDVMETSFVCLVHAIAKSGYEPQEHSVFNKLCIEKTLNNFNKMDIEEQISLAHDLSILQICPQEILSKIFSLEYLVLVDKQRARGLKLNKKIMNLNRCAVLEYPQLNIPWFHESFGAQIIHYFDMLDHCFHYLPEALSQVLGGPTFFQKNVLTPYFHPMYAELFLDENKRPVYYLKAKQVQARNAPYQPIAILALAEQSTRLDEDKKLPSMLQTIIRQLEIIGYKVVVIHSTEWNSMAMHDEDERVNYLMEKLFTV